MSNGLSGAVFIAGESWKLLIAFMSVSSTRLLFMDFMVLGFASLLILLAIVLSGDKWKITKGKVKWYII
jgi:hypothetical protein